MQCWRAVTQGKEQLAIIRGDAGIGKSHLVQGLVVQAGCPASQTLVFQCSALFKESALFPFKGYLSTLSNIQRSDDSLTIVEKLVNSIYRAQDCKRSLAALLSESEAQAFTATEPDPSKRKAETFNALYLQIRGAAATAPVICVIEDIQWIDPTSSELLNYLVEALKNQPVFIIVTTRADPRELGLQAFDPVQLHLSRIDDGGLEQIIAAMTDGKALPEELQRHSINQSDGIPLFAEAMTRAVIDAGLVTEIDGRFELIRPISQLPIPLTLQDPLSARLDAMGDAKSVAQMASVIGRIFAYGLIRKISNPEDVSIDDSLDRLESSSLLFSDGVVPDSTCTFKPGLLRDCAYQSLVRERKRDLHELMARALIELQPLDVGQDFAIVAHHFAEAGNVSEAILYWHRAAEKSYRDGNYQEAFNITDRALKSLDDGAKSDLKEIETQLLLLRGILEIHLTGQGSETALQDYDRARQLARNGKDYEHQFQAQWGIHFVNMVRGQLKTSRDVGLDLIPLARKTGKQDLLLEAHHAQWSTMFTLGQIEACGEHVDNAIAIYNKDDHHYLTFEYGGHDPGVCARDVGAITSWLLGNPNRARQLMADAVQLSDSLDHPYTIFSCLVCASMIYLWDNQFVAVQRAADRIRVLVDQDKIPRVCENYMELARGAAIIGSGDLDAGFRLMADRIESVTEDLGPWALALKTRFAEGLQVVDSTPRALEYLDAEIDRVIADGTHWWDGEFYRIKAQLARTQGGDTEQSDHWLDMATNSAQSQNGLFLMLKTAITRVELAASAQKRRDAQLNLAGIVESFSPETILAELDTARTLLDSTL